MSSQKSLIERFVGQGKHKDMVSAQKEKLTQAMGKFQVSWCCLQGMVDIHFIAVEHSNTPSKHNEADNGQAA